MKGIILERSRKGCIILTDEGIFKEIGVWKSQWDIGEKINLSQPSGRLGKNQYVMIAATLVLLLLPLAIIHSLMNPQVAVYYTMDINPSIELGVSSKDMVVSVMGKNPDGILLLQDMSLINLPIEKAISMITKKAYSSGYIKASEDNDIILAQVPVSSTYMTGEGDGKRQKIAQATRDLLNQFSLKGNVHSLVLTSDVRKEAEKKGVSAGKYAILLVAEEKGMNITHEDIQSAEIRKIVTKAGMDYNEIVEEAEKVKDFTKLIDEKRDEKITGSSSENIKQNRSPYVSHLEDVNEKDQKKNHEQNKHKSNFHKDQGKKKSKQNEEHANEKENKDSSKRNGNKGTTIKSQNKKLFFNHPVSGKSAKVKSHYDKSIKKKMNKKNEYTVGKEKASIRKKQNLIKGTEQKKKGVEKNHNWKKGKRDQGKRNLPSTK